MKKQLFTLGFLLFSQFIFAQRLELFGGPSYTTFTGSESDGHYRADFIGKPGFSAGIGLEDVKVLKKVRLRFSVKYDQYGGKIDVSNGGNGANYSYLEEFDKSSVSIGFYPLNAVVFKNLWLSMGAEFTFMTSKQSEGYLRTWSMLNQTTTITPFSESTIHEPFAWGISTRIAYDLKLMENWSVVPQYMFSAGLKEEMATGKMGVLGRVSTIRNYIGLGIVRKL